MLDLTFRACFFLSWGNIRSGLTIAASSEPIKRWMDIFSGLPLIKVGNWSMKACWKFQVTASTLFEDGGNYIALLLVFTHPPKIELKKTHFLWDLYVSISFSSNCGN